MRQATAAAQEQVEWTAPKGEFTPRRTDRTRFAPFRVEVAVKKGASVEVQTIVVPDPGSGGGLVDRQARGVCHTDRHRRDGVITGARYAVEKFSALQINGGLLLQPGRRPGTGHHTPVLPTVIIEMMALAILVVNIRRPQIFTVVTSIGIIMIYLAYLGVTAPMLVARLGGDSLRARASSP